METNRGAPTPPIAFADGAGGATDRLDGRRVEVDDALQARLAATGADVSTRAAEIVTEASRDWWPLAMIWALDDQVAARAQSVVVRPARRRRGREPCCAVQRRARSRSPPPRGAAACAARACRCSAACCSTSPRSTGIVDVDQTSMLVDVLPGTFGDVFEDELRAEHGVTCGHWPQSMALSTVGGWLACRGAGQLSTRYGKIEDIVDGLDVVLADGTLVTTGGAPRAAVGPDLTQLFVGSEGTLGIIVGARLRAASELPPPRSAPRTRSASFADGARRHAPHRAARRDAGGAAALRRDRSRPQLPDRRRERAARRSTKATRTSSMRPAASSTRSARPPTPIDVGLVEQWMEHRNDVSALEALIQRGFVVDTMESLGARGARCPTIYERTTAAIRGVEHTMVASAHQSHSYTDGGVPLLHVRGPPARRPSARRTTAPRGTRDSAASSSTAARSATTTASA